MLKILVIIAVIVAVVVLANVVIDRIEDWKRGNSR